MSAPVTTQSRPTLPPPAAGGLVLPGDRASEVVAFESEMVAFFVDAAELLGVPKSVAAIYGIVFASPEPLSFSEIEGRLAISKGSVSQGIRVLRDVGAIKEAQSSKLTARSSQSYEPDMELRKLIKHFLESRLQDQLETSRGRLQQLESKIPDADAEHAAILRDRTKYLASWNKKARALMPIAKTFLKLS